jgi:hypothetical protein
MNKRLDAAGDVSNPVDVFRLKSASSFPRTRAAIAEGLSTDTEVLVISGTAPSTFFQANHPFNLELYFVYWNDYSRDIIASRSAVMPPRPAGSSFAPPAMPGTSAHPTGDTGGCAFPRGAPAKRA